MQEVDPGLMVLGRELVLQPGDPLEQDAQLVIRVTAPPARQDLAMLRLAERRQLFPGRRLGLRGQPLRHLPSDRRSVSDRPL